jgi:hypothetical protein
LFDPLVAILLNLAFWIGVSIAWPRSDTGDWLDHSLETLVIGFTAIVVCLEALGLLGFIGRTPIVAICIAVLTFGVVRGMNTRRPVAGRVIDAAQRRGRWLLAPGVAVAMGTGASLYYLVAGLLSPIEPVSDAPIYHVPFAVHWLRSGSLDLIPTPFGDAAATYFPSNGELWLTWLLATDPSGLLVKVGQWPFMLMGALALFGIGRHLVADSAAAVFPAVLWAALPLTLDQSAIANIDLIWCAVYLAAVCFLLRCLASARALRLRNVWCFALACGLVAGSKTVGALFVVLLLAPAATVVWRQDRWGKYAAAVLIGLLIPSAFWYARNFIVTGNPLYPVELSLFGQIIADGWYATSAMRVSAYHVPVTEWRFLLERLQIVAGSAGAWLIAAGLAAGWAVARDKSAAADTRRAALTCSMLAAAQLSVYWFLVPYNTQERFLLPAFALALVPFAAIAARWGWARLALPVLMSWQLLGTMIGPARPLFELSGQHAPVSRFYPHAGFAARMFPAWHIVEQHVGPEGGNIAYTGTNLPYYLFGIGFRNRVRYVNINALGDWLFHDYHRALVQEGTFQRSSDPYPQWYRAGGNFDAWLANLRRHAIQLVFIARENRHGRLDPYPGFFPEFPIEKRWADAHPELFEGLGPFDEMPDGVQWVSVYRLRPPATK